MFEQCESLVSLALTAERSLEPALRWRRHRSDAPARDDQWLVAYFEGLAGLAQMTEEQREQFFIEHDTYWC